jgi:hypothetical protein
VERIRTTYFRPPSGQGQPTDGSTSPQLQPSNGGASPDHMPPTYSESESGGAVGGVPGHQQQQPDGSVITLPPLPEGFVYGHNGAIYMASEQHGGYVPVAIDPTTAGITILPGEVVPFAIAHPQMAVSEHQMNGSSDVSQATPAGIVTGPPPTPALVYNPRTADGIDPITGLPIVQPPPGGHPSPDGVAAQHPQLQQLEQFLNPGIVDASGHPLPQPHLMNGTPTNVLSPTPQPQSSPPQGGTQRIPSADPRPSSVRPQPPVTERPKGAPDEPWIDPRSRPATPGGTNGTQNGSPVTPYVNINVGTNDGHIIGNGNNGHTSPTDMEQRRQNEERIQNLERELAMLRAGHGHGGHGPQSPITVSTSSTSLSSLSTASPITTPSTTPSHAVGVTSPNGHVHTPAAGARPLAFSPDGGVTPRQLHAMGKTYSTFVPVDYPHGICNHSQPIGDPRLVLATAGIRCSWTCCGSTSFAPSSHIVPGQGCGPDVRDVAVVINGEHKSAMSPVTPVLDTNGTNGHATTPNGTSHGTGESQNGILSEIEAGVAGLQGHRRTASNDHPGSGSGSSTPNGINGHHTLTHSQSLVTMPVEEGDEDDEDDSKASQNGRPNTMTARDIRALEAKKKFEEQKAAAARKKQAEKEQKELAAKQAAAKFDNLFGSGTFRI